MFCPQLLLHFFVDSFETLYTGRLLYGHVHIARKWGFNNFFAKLWPFELWRFHSNLSTLTMFCPHLLLHFFKDSFETLYIGSLLYGHVHIARKLGLNKFSKSYKPLNLGPNIIFDVFGACSVHNSSYISLQILLKLYILEDYYMDMCILQGNGV